jgi:hypothetical protein
MEAEMGESLFENNLSKKKVSKILSQKQAGHSGTCL